MILKGSFEIVNFQEYFLVRNTDNLNEKEYCWGGIVPYEGKKTLITFSKNIAKWSGNCLITISSKKKIIKPKIRVSIPFIGGNNEIISINVTSSQISNFITDKSKKECLVEFKKLYSKRYEFNINIEFKNICKGEWDVNLTDEQIEQLIPEEDKLCKEQLKNIAESIIKEFDENNKNNDFVFLDYMLSFC